MNTIRNYRNKVMLHFDQRGDSFSLKVPHYHKWSAIIAMLRKRGFTITENPSFKKHYKCLSKYHKLGFKKNVACLMEIRADAIEVEFGNRQNLWTGIAQSFWNNPTDDRYTKLTYLENLAVKLEVKRLIDFCKKYKMELKKEDSELTPEQYIIHTLKVNTHIHGKVECLNDIKLAIKEDSYDYRCNSDDKNKKKIICGETKYFYDYRTNRLSCGTVWHHINNMWWVIVNKQRYNIAAFYLFDFDPTLPRRKAVDKSKIDSLLKGFEVKRDYQRCMHIQKYADRLFA